MKLPHQVLGAAFGRVRAPGARTAAPKVKNCRTGATMLMQQLLRMTRKERSYVTLSTFVWCYRLICP